MRISDWSSDVCSSDLPEDVALATRIHHLLHVEGFTVEGARKALAGQGERAPLDTASPPVPASSNGVPLQALVALRQRLATALDRSEEHTSELQSLMRNSYAVFCLTKKINQ